MLLGPDLDSGKTTADPDIEALIKEARRLRRRRWGLRALIAMLVVGAGASYIALSQPPAASHPPGSATRSPDPNSSATKHPLEPTHSPDLIQPTTLAALPNGDVLILDSSRDQILEMKRGGNLSVFAGNGRLGFAGDGGPAQDAELDLSYFSSAGMAVTPNGGVDFLDDGNCRIREISPDGIIRTVLHLPLVKVYPHGTACPVAAFAVSPAGSVYIATDSEVERVLSNGRLVWVAGAQRSGAHKLPYLTPSHVAFFPSSLAFNDAGDLYIWNFSPKVILRLTPTGKLTQLTGVSYATQLTAAPNGTVLAGTHGGEVQELTAAGVRRFYDVVPRQVAGIHWGRDQGFQENGIAITRTGTVYVDNAAGNGYGDGTVLVRISPDKHAALVPIRTPLMASLPKLGAPGFPAFRYPAARSPRGSGLASCPSDKGLERFTPQAVAQAENIAKKYRSSQFASDIAVTDRSWWTADFREFAFGGGLGRHAVSGETLTAASPMAADIARACGSMLVDESIAVRVGRSGYSDFTGTLYFLDRNGQPLVYYVGG